jgi:hypothetical protein
MAFSCFFDEYMSKSLLDEGDSSPEALPKEDKNIY